MSDLEKTSAQSSCSMNGSPQKLIKNNNTDARNVSKNTKDIETVRNFNINNNEEIKCCKSGSDVPDKINTKDKEIIDFITQLALPFVKEVKEMIHSEITFDEMEKLCSSYVDHLMKTFEKNKKLDNNKKPDWKLFKIQEKNVRETYNKLSKEISYLDTVLKSLQDKMNKNGPLFMPLIVKKSVATQFNSIQKDHSPGDHILQSSSKLQNSTFTGCEILAVNSVSSSSSCSNVITISSDDE